MTGSRLQEILSRVGDFASVIQIFPQATRGELDPDTFGPDPSSVTVFRYDGV